MVCVVVWGVLFGGLCVCVVVGGVGVLVWVGFFLCFLLVLEAGEGVVGGG